MKRRSGRFTLLMPSELLGQLALKIAELRARSPSTVRGAAVDEGILEWDPSRAGLRAGRRDSGAVSLWQADRQLHGAHSVRGRTLRIISC
jgi:hypothetical protein